MLRFEIITPVIPRPPCLRCEVGLSAGGDVGNLGLGHAFPPLTPAKAATPSSTSPSRTHTEIRRLAVEPRSSSSSSAFAPLVRLVFRERVRPSGVPDSRMTSRFKGSNRTDSWTATRRMRMRLLLSLLLPNSDRSFPNFQFHLNLPIAAL